MILSFQQAAQPVGTHLGSAKNDDRVVVHLTEQREYEVVFLVECDRVNRVRNGFSDRTAHPNFHRLRIGHRPLDDRLDDRRDGR